MRRLFTSNREVTEGDQPPGLEARIFLVKEIK
jgi:hypothetical protein